MLAASVVLPIGRLDAASPEQPASSLAPTARVSDPPSTALLAARNRALAYFASRVATADPGWLGLFGYLHRRFGVSVRMATGEALHTLRGGTGRPELYAVYRRIDDPDARVEKAQIAALPTAVDRITASALHCQRIPLPGDWIAILGKASQAGGYALTHAVLATEWSVENGCIARADVAELHAEQVRRLEQLAERRAAPAGTSDAAVDLWIEAMVMLYYSGTGVHVRPAWVAELLSLQRDDGGWPRRIDVPTSDAHATALALWVVLENLQPGTPRVDWIAPRR